MGQDGHQFLGVRHHHVVQFRLVRWLGYGRHVAFHGLEIVLPFAVEGDGDEEENARFVVMDETAGHVGRAGGGFSLETDEQSRDFPLIVHCDDFRGGIVVADDEQAFVFRLPSRRDLGLRPDAAGGGEDENRQALYSNEMTPEAAMA